jgi:glucose/arabinose dehydrogenase
MLMRLWTLVSATSLCLLCAATASAQLRADVYVSGLSSPLAFVQDPSNRNVQYIVQQGGRIRVVNNGVLEATDFINITSSVLSGGERGLLGLAFAPDYAASGRFYVNFTRQPDGNTVIARFKRSGGNPLTADPATRFDLLWPEGNTQNRFIGQPFSNHNGGTLAFGPDGYLYIALGDGGSGNDPEHRAQDPTTLLGKMLRVNVNVAESDLEGYDVPTDNPFFDDLPIPALNEIWAFGLRNPWKFSFDDPSLGGTGALIIGDVGQSAWEEIDYEPPASGGRNYGWRNREGAHDGSNTSEPLAYGPPVDPIWEYNHSVGNSITGGYVYRGTLLGAAFNGRYFYADISGRVWSIALSINQTTGEATVLNEVEHTSALGGSSVLGLVSSFGVDADGELYIVSLTGGTVLKVTTSGPPLMSLDAPTAGTVRQPFTASGWAIDPGAASTSGIDAVHVWAFPADGSPAIFAGEATYGLSRPDVGAAYGTRFTNSGFNLAVRGLRAGAYQLVAFGHSTISGTFNVARVVNITAAKNPLLAIGVPSNGSAVTAPFVVNGWALDLAAASGTGVDAVHVWAYGPSPQQTGNFVGVASYGVARPDVGSIFGSSFTNSGFNLDARGLRPGRYELAVYAHSTVSNAFDNVSRLIIDVRSSVQMSVDTPTTGAVLSQPFPISGWALDQSAPADTGVDAIHVWAFPVGGGASVFLGVAAYGGSRSDVGAAYGAQFTNSAFQLSATGLALGVYDLVVFVRSSVTGSFSDARVVRITVN